MGIGIELDCPETNCRNENDSGGNEIGRGGGVGVGDVGRKGADDSGERAQRLVDAENATAHVFGGGFADEAAETGLGESVSGTEKDGTTDDRNPGLDEGH